MIFRILAVALPEQLYCGERKSLSMSTPQQEIQIEVFNVYPVVFAEVTGVGAYHTFGHSHVPNIFP